MKFWIARMTNTKALLKGLKMNLTWTQLIGKLPRKKNAKLVISHKKKSKPIRFKKQALSEIASELKALADLSVRQYQMMMEAERKREERNMAFRKVESEKKRVHELRIVEIFSRSCQQAQMLQPQ